MKFVIDITQEEFDNFKEFIYKPHFKMNQIKVAAILIRWFGGLVDPEIKDMLKPEAEKKS